MSVIFTHQQAVDPRKEYSYIPRRTPASPEKFENQTDIELQEKLRERQSRQYIPRIASPRAAELPKSLAESQPYAPWKASDTATRVMRECNKRIVTPNDTAAGVRVDSPRQTGGKSRGDFAPKNNISSLGAFQFELD